MTRNRWTRFFVKANATFVTHTFCNPSWSFWIPEISHVEARFAFNICIVNCAHVLNDLFSSNDEIYGVFMSESEIGWSHFGWLCILGKEVANRHGSGESLMSVVHEYEYTAGNVTDKQSMKTLWILKIKTLFAWLFGNEAFVEENYYLLTMKQQTNIMTFGKHPKRNVAYHSPCLFRLQNHVLARRMIEFASFWQNKLKKDRKKLSSHS